MYDPTYEVPRIGKFMELESRRAVIWGCGEGKSLSKYRVSVWGGERALETMVVAVAQLCECT